MGNSLTYGSSWPGRGPPATKAFQLPVDFTPSEETRVRAYQGEFILIRGSALAKADLVTRAMRNLEVAWYWVGHEDDPVVIEDLYLPERQTVSSAHVSVPPEAVAAANRAVRRLGKVIVGAGHSHHGLGASTSMIDVDLFGQLAQEGAGYRSCVWHSATGRAPAVAPDVEKDAPKRIENRVEFRVTFDECPDTELLVNAPGDVSPEDLGLELKWRDTRLLSLFSTHDWFQTLHFPLLEVVRCGRCGERTAERFLPPATMLIIGPTVLDVEQRRQTLAALERHAPRRVSWAVSTDPVGPPTKGRAEGDSVDSGSLSAEVMSDLQVGAEGSETRPAPFEVYRRGSSTPIAVVAAAVLEEAAHRVPALGRALGWSDTDATPPGAAGLPSATATPTENPN
jgi:hypothetical protein